MFKNLYYLLFSLILSFSIGVGYSQDVPELMYFKFDQSTGNQTPNDANPVTRLGGPTGTVNGNLTVGGVGQFGTALIGTASSSTANYLDAGWTGNYTGDWTISMYLDVTESGSNGTQYFFGSASSSSFRCFTGGVAYENVLLRGTGITDVTIEDLYPGPVVVTFTYNATTNVVKGYRNGVLETTVNNWTSPVIQGSDFKIGGYSSSNGVNGALDEFRFYNRTLDDGEVGVVWNQMLPLTNCSGQPNLGAINGPNEVCPGVPFSISATGTNAAGFVYQWQESTPGTNNWNDIAGAVGSAYSFANGISVDTDYRVIATCTNSNLSDTSATLAITVNLPSECYCIPQATNSSRYINNFSTTGGFANISNLASGFSPGGYGDFTAMTVSQVILQDVSFSTNI